MEKQKKTKRERVRFGCSFLFLFWKVNKSQGQTFQKVAIYLPPLVFAHGQIYVTLSRTRLEDPINITMMIIQPPLHGQPPPALITLNVFYKQVFVYMQPPQQPPRNDGSIEYHYSAQADLAKEKPQKRNVKESSKQ